MKRLETTLARRFLCSPLPRHRFLGYTGSRVRRSWLPPIRPAGFGTSTTSLFLFPFAAIFGGLAQFLAGMWAYKERGAATAIHAMWGSFWMACGLLNALFALGRLAPPVGRWPEIGFWFVVLAAITWVGVGAAVAENRGFVTLLTFLGATAAIGELTGVAWLMIPTGYFIHHRRGRRLVQEALGCEIWSLGNIRKAREMGQFRLERENPV